MPANPLILTEREDIKELLGQHMSFHAIARFLGRSHSSIAREVNRNGGPGRYRPSAAENRAIQQRKRPKQCRFETDPALAAHVRTRNQLRDSPWTIAFELANGTHGLTASISHETIYQAIYRGSLDDPDPSTPQAWRCLPRARRHRKRRGHPRTGGNRVTGFKPISARPPIAWDRTEPGHLEGDTITGAYNRSALITLVDRHSRYLWLIKPGPGPRADAVRDALIKTLSTLPHHLRRTLTWDQGSEIARHTEIAAATGIDIYLADPHSPWQRPTNENTNALVRRYVGKGTDLTPITTKQLATIQHRINTIPRRIFNGNTATHLYHHAIAMTG